MSMIQPLEQPKKHSSFEKNNFEKNGSSQNVSETATISCAACGAVYVPSQVHPYLRYAPPIILESALSSMSHFCFRCRRAACPSCWDSVHGICGACVEEVQLTFRVEATPLAGLMFPPVRFDQTEQNGQDGQEEKYTAPLLVCVHPGRFQRDISLSTDPLKSVAVALPPEAKPASTAPSIEGETSARVDEASTRVGARPVPTTDKMDKQVPEADLTSIVGAAPTLGRDGQPQGIAPTDEGRGKPALAEEDEDEEDDSKLNLLARIFHVAERIVTFTLLIILLAIVVLIVLAEVSVSANAQILRFLHIDIRHEIAYLFSLIQQLRW